MRTFVYVDGFNLYYGAVKGTPYKWLDMRKYATFVKPIRNGVLSVSQFPTRMKDSTGEFYKPPAW
jgi:hypothetical protein